MWRARQVRDSEGRLVDYQIFSVKSLAEAVRRSPLFFAPTIVHQASHSNTRSHSISR